MDTETRDQVWARWLEEYPEDEGCDDAMRDALLDTYRGQALALRVAGEDFTEPFRSMLGKMSDAMDERMRAMSESHLMDVLRRTR